VLSRSQPQFAEVPFLSMSACGIPSHKDDSPIGCNCLITMKVQPSQNSRPPVAFHAMCVGPRNTVTNAFRRHLETIGSKLSIVPSIRRMMSSGVFPMLCIGKPRPVPAGLKRLAHIRCAGTLRVAQDCASRRCVLCTQFTANCSPMGCEFGHNTMREKASVSACVRGVILS
jgi:hypothetical protein